MSAGARRMDDEDLARAYDAVILMRPYLRADVTAEERAAIAGDIVACVARPLRAALRARDDRLTHAIFWLLRAYASGHRQGWEPGPSVRETMDGLHAWLCNEGFDPALKDTPQFVPDIRRALR